MKTRLTALHGEDRGIIRRMPDDHEAGYGPSYVHDRGEGGWVFYVSDCHWPNFYFIRCASLEEAIEHAEVCLCDIDEEVEQAIANLSADDIADGDRATELVEDADASWGPDGRVRTTWALLYIQIHSR